MHEPWHANYNEEFQGEIERFEEMENGHKTHYFDVHTIETIFDFYTDKFQFEKAEKALMVGIRQHPGSTSLKVKQAIILMERGEDQAAITLMEYLLEMEQSNPDIFMNLGIAYLRNNQVKRGIQLFKKALKVSADEKEEILLEVGACLNQHELHSIAIEFLEPGCKEFPNNENLLFELAFAHDKVFNIEKSLETYNRLIDINPFSENAWYNLGILHIKMDNFDKANECYDFTLAINPAHGEALFNKGNSLVNQGEFLKAVDCYIDYISHGYDVILPYHYIADCLDQAGLIDLSKRFYQLTIEREPSYLPAWIGYLALLINQAEGVESLTLSARALEIHPGVDELIYLRARSLLLNNMIREAKKAFETCFRDNPDNLRNAFELFQIKRALSPRLNVSKLLKNWLKTFPESPAIHYLACAHFLLDERDLSIAAKHLETALTQDPDEYQFFLELFPAIERIVTRSKKLNKIVNDLLFEVD